MLGHDAAGAVSERLEPSGEQVHPDQVGHVAGPWGVPQLLRSALLRDPSVLEHHDPVGERHRLDGVVRDHDPHAGEPAQDRPDQRTELRAGADVERGGRLVQQQQAWLVDQGARERDPLSLAAREIGRTRVAAFGREPEPL